MTIGPEGWTALWLSVRVSVVATIAILPLALVTAHVLSRRNFPGKSLFNALVHLPLVLPPVVTGYLLLLFFGRQGPGGRMLEEVFGLVLAFRWTGAALAAGVMGFPLMVRAIKLAFDAVDPRVEQAASTLGAGRWAVFRTVTWPLILPGVLAGSVLCFAKALGEFGATITFVAAIPGETQTLPSAIYAFLQVPGAEAEVVGLVVLSLVVAFAAVAGSDWLSARMIARQESRR